MDATYDKLARLRGLGTPPPKPFDPSALRSGTLLRTELGGIDRALWTPIRRGWWMSTASANGLRAADLLAAKAHAAQFSSRQDLVFSHHTAAAILGLPVLNSHQLVDIIADDRHGHLLHANRHYSSVPVSTVRCGALTVTSPARTVVDVARTDLIGGLMCADQALRHELCTREDLLKEAAAIPRSAPGRARALTVVNLADPLSMSPGESYSRALMFIHAIPRPELQVYLTDAAGEIGFGDFGWEGVVGEFDGTDKYGIGANLPAVEVTRRVAREKERENRIRLTGPMVVRWTWADLMNPPEFLAKLRAVGLHPGSGGPWLTQSNVA